LDQIANEKFPAYFEAVPECDDQFFVVIPMTMEFRKYDRVWRRLAKGMLLKVCLFDSWDAEEHQDKWYLYLSESNFCHLMLTFHRQGKIMRYPNDIPEISWHPTEASELVVRVRKPSELVTPPYDIKSFDDRPAANSALKKDKKQ
jgi:hypothetical protein